MASLLPHSPGTSAGPASVIPQAGKAEPRATARLAHGQVTLKGKFLELCGVTLSRGGVLGGLGTQRAVLSTEVSQPQSGVKQVGGQAPSQEQVDLSAASTPRALG